MPRTRVASANFGKRSRANKSLSGNNKAATITRLKTISVQYIQSSGLVVELKSKKNEKEHCLAFQRYVLALVTMFVRCANSHFREGNCAPITNVWINSLSLLGCLTFADALIHAERFRSWLHGREWFFKAIKEGDTHEASQADYSQIETY